MKIKRFPKVKIGKWLGLPDIGKPAKNLSAAGRDTMIQRAEEKRARRRSRNLDEGR